MKRSIAKAVFCIVTSMFILFAGLNSVMATAGANINLSKLTGYQGETTIAIDPTNPNRMFASSNMSTANMFGAYSTDGGTTWTGRLIATGSDGLPAACCDPSATFDRFGNLYLAYLTNSPVNVVVALSTNGGQTFTGTTLAGDSKVLAMFPFEAGDPSIQDKRLLEQKSDDLDQPDALNSPGDQPTIAAGPSFFAGEAGIWVTWNNGGIKVAGTRATALGAVTPFSTIVTAPIGGSFGDIEVGPSGQVMVVSTGSSGQGPVNINVSLDPDGLGPAIFQPPVTVPTKSSEAAGMEKGSPWMNSDVFGGTILVTATNVGGFDFIPAQPNRSIDAEPDLAWDKSGGIHNGRVYLAYTDETVNENNDTDIMLRYSDNNGTTWTAPLRVNDDATTRGQFFPRIDVDQTTGNLAAAFYDCRNDAAGTDGVANTETDVYGAVSLNGGTSFAPNEKISQGTSRSPSFSNANEYGDYNGLAFFNGKYFYIWSDNSNSTADNPNGTRAAPDVYTAKVTIPNVSVSGRVITRDGRGVRNAFVTLTDSHNNIRRVITGPFGNYRFDSVPPGPSYVAGVTSRRFQFDPIVISPTSDLAGLNFVSR